MFGASGANILPQCLNFLTFYTGNECFEGHYCPEGTGYPIQCTFGNFTNTTGQAECTICPEGW